MPCRLRLRVTRCSSTTHRRRAAGRGRGTLQGVKVAHVEADDARVRAHVHCSSTRIMCASSASNADETKGVVALGMPVVAEKLARREPRVVESHQDGHQLLGRRALHPARYRQGQTGAITIVLIAMPDAANTRTASGSSLVLFEMCTSAGGFDMHRERASMLERCSPRGRPLQRSRSAPTTAGRRNLR